MNRKDLRRNIKTKIKELAKANSQYSTEFVEIPNDLWHVMPYVSGERLKVFRNVSFLVQLFRENGMLRITVNRTQIDSNGDWKEGISWDQLQNIKRAIGFGDQLAVEIYPRDEDIVDVANMRHLWLIHNDTQLGWKKENKKPV